MITEITQTRCNYLTHIEILFTEKYLQHLENFFFCIVYIHEFGYWCKKKKQNQEN